MHIHSHATNFNTVDLSSTRAAEKAVSAQRAGDVRSQLLRGGLDVEGEIDPFESFMVGSEPERRSRQQPSQNQKSPVQSGERPQSAENEQAEEPLSFWA